jgi:hypothetical protein
MLTATHENKSGYRSLWQFRSKLPLVVGSDRLHQHEDESINKYRH